MVKVLFVSALFVALLGAGNCKLSVTRKGSVYLPSEGGNFTLNRRAVTCSCFDRAAKLIYSTNGHNIVVIDAKKFSHLKIIGKQVFPKKYTFNEITCRGAFIGVVASDSKDPANGQLLILRAWDGHGMDIVQKLTVGSNPAAIMTGKDKKSLIVTDSGTPYVDKHGRTVDPLGGIVIFKFKSTDLSKRPSVHRVTAKSFNGQAKELRHNRVRIQDGVSVAQQFTPVFTTGDDDGNFLYTTLPFMNAVARIDIRRAKLISIISLGTFDWTGIPIDTTRARKPNLRPQPMASLFQPREIRFVRDEKNRPRLLLGNEGFIRPGEGITGKEIIKQGLLDPSVSADVRHRLKKSSELGDVIFSTTDGLNPDTGYIQVPTSFGTRSFSIRRIRSADIVYDSDDLIEAEIAEAFPKIFNAEVVPNKVVKATASRASVNIGPGPGSVHFGKDNCGQNLIFVGTRNPGTLHVFSWTKLREPQFESVISGVEDPHLTWEELFAQKRTGDLNIDFEGSFSAGDGIKFPFLIVAGIDSGTVSIYEIKNDHC